MIRHITLIPFEEIIEIPCEDKFQMILEQIDCSKLLFELGKSKNVGRNGYGVIQKLTALIAMQVEKMPHVSALVKRLKTDPFFKLSCGFELQDQTPSEATFSRFKDKLTDSKAFEALFNQLVELSSTKCLISGKTIAIDSTKIDSYDAPIARSKIEQDGSKPDWGKKKDHHGNDIRWFGFKLHLACDAGSELPVAFSLTPASVSDSKAGIEILELMAEGRHAYKKTKFFLMDAGYDIKTIYETVITTFKASPLIAFNKRGDMLHQKDLMTL